MIPLLTPFVKNKFPIRTAIVFMLLAVVAVKAYIPDMIVMFSPEAFCSGDDIIDYKVITRLEVFKRVDYPVGADNMVYFEMYNGDRYLGFDKLSEYDYEYLIEKVSEHQE